MNKTYLLRCWSSSPGLDGDIAAAVVRVDSKLREMAWELAKLRQVVCNRLVDQNFVSLAFSPSLELSVLDDCPEFIRGPRDQDRVPELLRVVDSMYGGAEDIEPGNSKIEIVTSTFDETEVADITLLDENVDKLVQWVECTKVHVLENGLNWTTCPKYNDGVEITTATLAWKDLGLK